MPAGIEGPLALIVDDTEGGYNVVDTRSGDPLAWRSELQSAAAVASFVNSTYPLGSTPPAHDTIVHEIVGYRITDEAPMPLDKWIKQATMKVCPAYIPRGPGWDHLYEEAA